MGLKRRFVVLAALLLGVGACGGESDMSDHRVPNRPAEAVTTLPVHTMPAADPTLGTGSSNEAGDPNVLYIKASNQDGDGKAVVVDGAVLSAPGWIVVHSAVGGGIGPVIGVSSKLPAGRSDAIGVTLKRPIVASEADVYAMVHADTGTEGVFEFPANDPPATVGEGSAVMVRVHLRIR